MSKKGYEPPLGLDMPFGEAMRRFARTDPDEIKGDKRLKGKRGNLKKEKPNPT